MLISLDFLDSWDEELKERNVKKRGRSYEFPEKFIQFMAFVHVLFLPYRQMKDKGQAYTSNIPCTRGYPHKSFNQGLR